VVRQKFFLGRGKISNYIHPAKGRRNKEFDIKKPEILLEF